MLYPLARGDESGNAAAGTATTPGENRLADSNAPEPGQEAGELMAEMEGLIGRSLRRASNAVAQRFSEHFAGTNIRPALYTVMTVIERYPHIAGRRISAIMEVPHANIVVVLKELEARGLVKRETDAADRRAQRISLTPEGRELLAGLHRLHARHLAELEAEMTPAERDFLLALLKRLWRGRTDAV